MSRIGRHTGLFLAALLAAAAPDARAQRRPPRIGYVWPAGGRRGETFDVTVGGQYLRSTDEVLVSGKGVRAEVADYTSPPTGKELVTIRDIWQKARKKAQAEAKAKGGRAGGRLALYQLFVKMAKEKGVTDKQLEAFNRFRKNRADPKRQLNPQLSESVKVRVTVAADAPLGGRELRLTTKLGLSNPLRFHVGELPECREAEPNDQASAATVVAALPAVLNGQIMPGDVDRFRFRAARGQQLVVDVAARELIPYLADAVPGWFQATVALYDADGREVAYADDYRFDPDPVLLCRIPRDGEYVLEIRDAIYRGREDFVYRVAVGELPFVSSVFPMGARRGRRVTVAVDGWNLPPDQLKLDFRPGATGLLPLAVRGKTWAANTVMLAAGDWPEAVEAEPNDRPAGAAALTLPRVVNGRIGRPGDRDGFRFRARAGDRVVAEVRARRLGSPLDSLLELTDAAGRRLALNDDHEDRGAGLVTHHADSLLSVSIPAAGEYLLWVSDTQHKGGRAYGYRLRVGPARPDFELRVVPSALSARGGTVVPITVHALRRDGFAGEIALQLKDAPAGFKLSGARVPAGSDSARLTLTVPAKPERKLTPLHLEGTATVGGREVRRAAVPADDTMQAFLYRHLVGAESWTAAVQAVRWSGWGWTVATDRTVTLRPGGTARLRVRGRRAAPFRQLRLALDDPPDGITIQKLTPVVGGLVLVLRADAGKAKPGTKGNLIINASVERKPAAKAGQPPPKARLVPAGVLPAVPFEIVAR